MLPIIFQDASFTYAFLEGGSGSESAIEMLIQVGVKAALQHGSRFDEFEAGMDNDHDQFDEGKGDVYDHPGEGVDDCSLPKEQD